jgi:signal peptidase II
VENSGGAFGILSGQTLALSIITAAVIAAIFIYISIKRKTDERGALIALSLICAGGAGNLIDRVRSGVVTDFIDFRVFPVFNVADICVCCGCGLLILFLILTGRKETAECEAATDER